MPIRWMGAVGITPDWQVLAQIEVEENCDYVDFTGLDINRDWEYYLDVTIKNAASSPSHYYLFVQEDYTLTNYYNQFIHGRGTTVVVRRDNDPTVSFISPGIEAAFNIKITKGLNGHFMYNIIENHIPGSDQRLEIRAGSKTAPVSNITSIRIAADVSGGIGAGSKFILARPRS